MRLSVKGSVPPALVGVVAEAALLGLALLLARWWGIGLIGHVGIGWPALAASLGLTVPPVALLGVMLRSRSPWALDLVRTVDQLAEHLLERASPLGLLALAVAAGAGEEALFRGVLQTAVQTPLGPVAAVGLVGALFGAVHAISIAYALIAAGMGVYLGTIFAATGNLLIPVIVHASYDLVALLVFRRRIKARKRRAEIPEHGETGL
jgi:membrane protease YdiL (CAAX protease family)